ncbi:MAG TPA: oligosaccharide flippase family protein [Burkholderiales bacterium]|nr:oligosaccharide flippase family protein [Burkholderiales bacterium]
MRVGRNLAAGIASSVWTALVGLAVIPVYVRHLGHEGYGLVALLTTAQAVFQALDLGLSTSINREIARETESGDLSDAPGLLRTVAAIYWTMALVIALSMLVFSHFMAAHWLSVQGLPIEDVEYAVALIGLVIACRWPGQLYQGALMGAQRIVVSSALSAGLVTLGSLGAAVVIALVSPSVSAFMLWQAGAGLVYTLAARAASWRVVGRGRARTDRAHLARIWRFSAGVTAITVTGIVLSQLDKIVLSKMLSLAEYGQYMVAFALAGTLYLFTLPLFNAVYPRFSGLVQSGDVDSLERTYRLATRLLATIVFPLAMLLAVFPAELIQAWTGDGELAANAALLLPILAVGTALHAVMYVPYALQLAYGTTRLQLTISALLLAFATPATIVLVLRFGAVGGALAWLSLHSLYLVLGTWLTHRRLLKGLGPEWMTREVGVPFAVSALVGVLAHIVSTDGALSLYARVACGAGWALAAFALAFVASPGLRGAALDRLRGMTYRIP